MTTCPAYVPTPEEETPEARSAVANATAAAPPSIDANLACASARVPIDATCPWKSRAATSSMLTLMSPAVPRAAPTSIRSMRRTWRRSSSVRQETRRLVSAEWRKMTCGIIVAPRMPTAR